MSKPRSRAAISTTFIKVFGGSIENRNLETKRQPRDRDKNASQNDHIHSCLWGENEAAKHNDRQ